MADSPTSGDAGPVAAAIAAHLEENQQTRAELIEAIDALSPAQRAQGWYGDGGWSVHDILAHIYRWQDGFAHALECIARGERPEIPDFDPQAPTGTDDYNAAGVADNRHLSWEELLAHLRAARERHEAAVKNLAGRIPPERYEEGRTARSLSNTANHDREHLTAILEWRRREGF